MTEGWLPEVVVGVDRSPQSLPVVEVAAAQARTRGARLRVIHVYDARQPTDVTTVAQATATTMWAGPRPEREDAVLRNARRVEAARQADAQHDAQKTLDRLLRGAGDALAGVDVSAEAVAGEKVGETLVDAAAGADLLVVGAAHGERTLGSTLRQCVRDAACSVLVVRGDPLAAR